MHPDSVSRPAGQACPGPGTGHDGRAQHDDRRAAPATGRRPEYRLDDLRLPDLGDVRVRRPRLGNRALDPASADLPAGHARRPRLLRVAGDLSVRAVLTGPLWCAGPVRARHAGVTPWAA